MNIKNITTFNFNELFKFKKIFVLVSGGIDSTYLYEIIKKIINRRNKELYNLQLNIFNLPFDLLCHSKVYPVNCYNPYETSKTLEQISNDPNYIQIRSSKKYNYGAILKESFLKIPEARKLKKQGKYHKKIFPCCYYIKHKAFLKDPLFKEDNTIVISGIKKGDGQQRFFWLNKLRKEQIFFYRHKGGQLYCYPFRDYQKRELPKDIILKLRNIYPSLHHSGCMICPVLVLFNITGEKIRYKKSIQYARKLKVFPYEDMNDFIY